jgi:hypothetical protein
LARNPVFDAAARYELTGKEERKEGVKNSPLHQPQLTPVIFPQAQIPVSQRLEVEKTVTANSKSISASDSKHPIANTLRG